MGGCVVSASYPLPFAVRRAREGEAGLILDLRLASLVAVEMANHPLASVRAVTIDLPDVDAQLLASGRYLVAETEGDLIGGAGWSVLPLRFRGESLVGEDGRPADLTLGGGSVLIRGFFLDPDMGRRGAGAALLAGIEADALRAGYSAAELVAPASAQLFYRSLGFRPVMKRGLSLGREVLPLVQMRRSFAARYAAAA